VVIEALSLKIDFAQEETIHTESSIKYDLPRVARLLDAAGFHRAATFQDAAGLFAVHLARGR
jgi:uncharacterized SAM-dependent methyltransferase